MLAVYCFLEGAKCGIEKEFLPKGATDSDFNVASFDCLANATK
jgi:hypothetical protein